MANVFYNKAKQLILNGGLDFDTDTIKASFHTTSYTPSADSDDFWDDATNEVSTSGSYTAGIAGGITLANKAVTQDNTDDEAVFDADDLSVTTFTGTFRWIVLRKDTGVAGTSPLICAIDATAVTASAGTVTVTWNSEGIINLN
jgi:hypothetical protein